jgi:hypothetical protein
VEFKLESLLVKIRLIWWDTLLGIGVMGQIAVMVMVDLILGLS